MGLLLVSPPPLAFLAGREFPELRAEADSLSARLDREAAAAEASSDPGVRAGAPRLRALASEHAMMFSTGAEQAGGIETLGDLPVTVIAAGNANPDFGAVAFRFQELWIAENARLAELSTRGRFLLARSGHRVHREAPDLIVREVIAMVDSVRAGAAE